jgi:adenylosuccinate lyase
MPFKRNPINAEKIDSLARLLAGMPRTAWDNAAHSLLERTLDDSANRRTLLPEAFLIVDEILGAARRILSGLRVDEGGIARSLATYGPFAGSEKVLMALAKAGADRQAMHERLRTHALVAWAAVQAGESNPLAERLSRDPEIIAYIPAGELPGLMDASGHVGDAPQRARRFAAHLRMVASRSGPTET